MQSAMPLISELRESFDNRDSGRRSDIALRITDLFLEGADAFTEEQVQLFDDVLMHLIERIELRALIRLSEVLAPIGNSPATVIRRLAFDDEIAVAGPVLAQSPRLMDSDLIAIGNSKSNAHLLAIAARSQLSIPVTDVLVRRGDAQVKHQLARNIGARFSEESFRTLLQDDVLTERLHERLDLPLNLLRELLVRATRTVHHRLAAAAPREAHDKIEEAVTGIAHEVSWEAMRPRDFSDAIRKVGALKAAGRLSEDGLAQFARERKYEEMAVALSLLSDCPLALTERLLKNIQPDGLLVLCRAASLTWPSTAAILRNRFGHHSMSASDLERARDSYVKLSDAIARSALAFWKARLKADSDDA